MTRCSLPGLVAILAVAGPVRSQGFFFEDVTAEVGLDVTLAPHTPGSAVGDFDDDGWLDIALFGLRETGGRMRLFRNNGADIAAGAQVPWFTDVTERAFPDGQRPSAMGMFVDMDGDGDRDLLVVERYVSGSHPFGDSDDTGLMVYENVGKRFFPAATPPDLARSPQRPGGLSVADVDVDGDLDIVYAHNVGANTGPGPAFFVRNDGFPSLVDATASFGADIGQENRYFSTLLADFDGDMLPDLHCAVDFYSDMHCKNLGGGVFADVTVAAGTTNTGADMGLAIGDPDNDGDLDMYSTNINVGVLYINDGQGHFTNEAGPRGCAGWTLGPSVIGWGTAFADFDHDRDEDLVFCAFGNPGHFYDNTGGGYFDRITPTVGMELRGSGLIPFDYDRDGDLDLWIMRTGAQTSALYENVSDTAGRHWLTVQLRGTTSNTDGIGSKVWVQAGGTQMLRAVMGGYSFKSGPPTEVHFGLGAVETIDELRIEWPDGKVQVLSGVAADQVLVVVEP